MPTSHCLIDIINFLTKNADRLGSVTTVIVTDFTQAFDRVDHSVIIAKLCEMCPSSSVVPWIVDFPSDRTQCVRYRGCLSEWTHIKAGVPQGTTLSLIKVEYFSFTPICGIIFKNYLKIIDLDNSIHSTL